MSLLPADLDRVLAERLGAVPQDARPLSGGMINQAARVEIAGRAVFVKWKIDAPPGFYEAEADGLARLRATGAVRVPDVLALRDRADGEETVPFLAIDFVEARPPRDLVLFGRGFGERLARLHRENISPDGQFGLERSNFLGSEIQENDPRGKWADFYRDCRIVPQIALAREKGMLPPYRERLLSHVVEGLDLFLADSDPVPALLHGDLWSGNFIAAGDEPVLIDPAVYYGSREVELAYVELFMGFPSGLVDSYNSAYPLDSGYAHRRPLHQLYPLLVHLNHFGESYGADVDAVCRRYVG